MCKPVDRTISQTKSTSAHLPLPARAPLPLWGRIRQTGYCGGGELKTGGGPERGLGERVQGPSFIPGGSWAKEAEVPRTQARDINLPDPAATEATLSSLGQFLPEANQTMLVTASALEPLPTQSSKEG